MADIPPDSGNPSNPDTPSDPSPARDIPSVGPVCDLRRIRELRAAAAAAAAASRNESLITQSPTRKAFFTNFLQLAKNVYSNQNVWRVFKGILLFVVAYKTAYELDLFKGSLWDHFDFDLSAVREYLNMEE